jgi:hypothetical protein
VLNGFESRRLQEEKKAGNGVVIDVSELRPLPDAFLDNETAFKRDFDNNFIRHSRYLM